MRLKDKAALITGGTGGMGRASARLFAKEGATVFVAARRPEKGAALVQEIEAAGGRAHFIQLDTTDQAGWDAAVANVKKKGLRARTSRPTSGCTTRNSARFRASSG